MFLGVSIEYSVSWANGYQLVLNLKIRSTRFIFAGTQYESRTVALESFLQFYCGKLHFSKFSITTLRFSGMGEGCLVLSQHFNIHSNCISSKLIWLLCKCNNNLQVN